MSLNCAYFVFIVLVTCPNNLNSFYFKTDPIASVNLIDLNSTNDNILKYPIIDESENNFRLLQSNKDFLVFGSKNKIVNIFINNTKLQFAEKIFSSEAKLNNLENKCSDQNCFNYILYILPINDNNDQFNSLICGTYYGLFQCFKAFQNKSNGLIEYYNKNNINAPKSLTHSLNNRNTFYLSKNELFENNQVDYVLYAASSWTENSQYLAAHTSRNNYQENDIFKKIGVSKSFVRFLENENKIILFHNEISFEVDEGEKDRDILLSTSLVTQFCKNDQEILNKKNHVFYTELTAKIYCFNKPFKSNSGNSKNFKFDSIEYVSELIEFTHKNKSLNRKLFYGVFNTPKDQITGTAICFFDMNDLSSVFEKKNFKNSNYDSSSVNFEFVPQTCPNLTYPQKEVYNKLTSKLGYMTKAILPVKKRKASFIMTKEYRLSTILVLDLQRDQFKFFPSIKKPNIYDHMNIILAGTDNGKIMRMVHFFNEKYFENEDLEEENFKILEDIQLFSSNVTINEIRVINSKTNISNIVVITNDQIKTISSDFCSFYSSCEQCLRANTHSDIFNEVCVWKNRCISMPQNDKFSKNNSNDCSLNSDSSELLNNQYPHDFILMVRNISSSEKENFAALNNSTILNEGINFLNQKQDIVLPYVIVGIGIVISILLIILLFILIIKKRNSKILKKIQKTIPTCKHDKSHNKRNSAEYIDNIYSYANTNNNRNQNLYQNNVRNNKIINNTDQTMCPERDEPRSWNTSSKIFSKPIHSIQEQSNYIIDYSLISTSLSGNMLDTEQIGNFPISHISFINLNQPIKFSNCMENSLNYQEAPSIIIASDDGDQCLENNYMSLVEKKRNDFKNSAMNSSVYSRNTLF